MPAGAARAGGDGGTRRRSWALLERVVLLDILYEIVKVRSAYRRMPTIQYTPDVGGDPGLEQVRREFRPEPNRFRVFRPESPGSRFPAINLCW